MLYPQAVSKPATVTHEGTAFGGVVSCFQSGNGINLWFKGITSDKVASSHDLYYLICDRDCYFDGGGCIKLAE
jgi:phosphoribosyl-AMP cyclohydrolase